MTFSVLPAKECTPRVPTENACKLVGLVRMSLLSLKLPHPWNDPLGNEAHDGVGYFP